MAITNCPECNKEVSSMAQCCPHCGRPLQAQSVEYVLRTGKAVSGSNLSTLLKAIAALTWAGGLILAIATGRAYSVSPSGRVSSEFSLVTFITVLLPFVIDGTILWCLGTLADEIKSTYSIVKDLSLTKEVSRRQAPGKGPTRVGPSAASPAKKLSSSWKCPHCGTQNDSYAPYCKSCGEYR